MIETERLMIRLYDEKDLDALSEFNLDEETMYYLSETFSSKEDLRTFFKEHKDMFYVVIHKDSETVIGQLSFKEFYVSSYEIGWVFNPKYRAEGYAYEAAYALMNYGFNHLNIHRIIATAQPENTASWKLMEKLKMRREGDFKACIHQNGEWRDEVYYAILKDECQ